MADLKKLFQWFANRPNPNKMSDVELNALTEQVLPKVLPHDWRLEKRGMDGAAYVHTVAPVVVIVGMDRENDGRRWVHFSMSHRERIPTFKELKTAKEIFLGDRKAIMIFPKKAEYINIHPNVLHLFSCLDDDPLPDFTRGSGSL